MQGKPDVRAELEMLSIEGYFISQFLFRRFLLQMGIKFSFESTGIHDLFCESDIYYGYVRRALFHELVLVSKSNISPVEHSSCGKGVFHFCQAPN